MKKYIYDIFRTSTKNECNDLTIALAMFLFDACKGEQKYGPDDVDYAALHNDCERLYAEEGELREFIGRHYEYLVAAYRFKDRNMFDTVVADCVAADEKE